MSEREVVITGYRKAECLPCERDPAALGPREVTGRTLVSLISAGTELAYFYNGERPAMFDGERFPTYPGYAAVFAVEEVGAEVTTLKPGVVAFCIGPHRSFQRVDEAHAIPMPPGLPPEVAVFARMMGITMSTLTTTTARPPQNVVVAGLGPVGHLAAQVFMMAGYQVIGCDPSDARREIARRHGITALFPTVPVEDSALRGQVALVLECSGHEAAALDACRIIRRRGEVVLVGVPWQRRTEISAHEFLHAVFHHYAVVRSGWEWELPVQPTEGRTGSLYENFAAALRWLDEGRIDVGGLGVELPPADASIAYEELQQGSSKSLTTLFRWDHVETV